MRRRDYAHLLSDRITVLDEANPIYKGQKRIVKMPDYIKQKPTDEQLLRWLFPAELVSHLKRVAHKNS